jgi:hypothetical protein
LTAKKIWYFITPNSEDSVALKKCIFTSQDYFLGHRGLQDKYNIGLLTVNIDFILLGAKRGERLARSSSYTPFLSLVK